MSETTAELDAGQEPQDGDQGPQEPPSPALDPDPAPDPAKSNLAERRPRNPNGHYVLIAAKVTESQPLRFRMLGFTKARSPEHAKEIVADDPVHGPKLRKDAEDHGIVLRAIPARWWPNTEVTRVEVTKQLVLR